MKKTKFISVLLSLVLLVTFTLTPDIGAKAAGDPTLTVGTVEGTAGEEVSLTIDISNNPGICTMYLSISYDAALSLVKVTDAKLLTGPVFGGDKTANPYIVSWDDSANPDGDISDNGAIVTLVFQVAETATAGTHEVSVSYKKGDIYNIDMDEFEFVTVAGGVTIAGTENPETTGTENPETTGTENPETTGTENPETTGTENPETTGTENPETTGTENPETTGTENPETTGTEQPTGTQAPDKTASGSAIVVNPTQAPTYTPPTNVYVVPTPTPVVTTPTPTPEVEKSNKTVVTNKDGSKTTTETVENKDGSKVTTVVKEDASGKEISSKTTTVKDNKDGGQTVKTETKKADGSTTYEVEKTDKDGNVTKEGVYYTAGESTIIKKQSIDADGDVEKKNYTVETSDTIKLSKVKTNNETVTVPSTVKVNGKKYTVDAIAKKVFAGNKSIETVKIAKTVKKIGKGAFKNASNLKKTVIYSTEITKIYKGAFKGIADDAVFYIYADKETYKKIVKMIKKSGVSDTVKFVRKNTK